MTLINAYLTFNGNCLEAMKFYQDCLGGELTTQTVESSPMAAQMPERIQKQILHSTLIKDSLVLMASDIVRNNTYLKGNTISLTLNCSTEDELHQFFQNLSKNGEILDPIQEQFWGAKFGSLTDKYGIIWLLNYARQ